MSGTPEIRTLLCFDFGTKRIGVAIGKVVTKLASALTTVRNKNSRPDWEHISRLIEEWCPDAFVVGMPLDLEGEPQEMTKSVQRFMRQLQGRWTLPVYDIDERLSSFEAAQRTGRQRNIDAVAAQVILETWFAHEYDKRSAEIMKTN